jgi:hypothetical protein
VLWQNQARTVVAKVPKKRNLTAKNVAGRRWLNSAERVSGKKEIHPAKGSEYLCRAEGNKSSN